ncbi:MAG: ABC transporter ATP-binding protein [Planctomycetia bacterium]|nr:ABC transporter ATP-binding protein [Planctomycetia bacterium]
MALSLVHTKGHAVPIDSRPHHLTPFQRLWQLLRPEWPDISVIAIFSVGIGLLALSIPITVEALVGSVQGGNTAMTQQVIVLAVILLICLLLAGAMRAWSQYLAEFFQRRLFVRIVSDLADRLPRVKTQALDGYHGPELVNRFFDVLTMQKAAAVLLLDGLAVVIQGMIGLAVLAVWHPYLLGFNLALLISLMFLIWALGYGGVQAKITESYAKYAVAAWMEELIRHPHTFKTVDSQTYASDRADRLTVDYLLARQDSFQILFRQIVFGIMLQALASATLLGLGGWLVIRNELTIGQLVAAELIVAVTVGSLIKLGKSIESYYDLMSAVDKLGHLLDLETERCEGQEPHVDGPASLEVRDLSFSYCGRGGVNRASFRIDPRERVALTGSPGSGKSTLLALLQADRDPDRGVIRLDGIDARQLSLDAYRQRVAAAGVCEVFDGSILDNITLGRSCVTLNEARQALELVQLLEEVERLPEGIQTRLVTGGAPLSGSQADRLMLARAIAGKPGLLLVDDLLDRMEPELCRRTLAMLIAPDAPWTLVIATTRADVMAACQRVIQPSGAVR